MSQTKRLIRKCWCGNILIVDVSGAIALVQCSSSPPTVRRHVAYTNLECIDETCYLRKRVFRGYRMLRKSLQQTNRNGFRAVFCRCGRIKHLSQFVEPKA